MNVKWIGSPNFTQGRGGFAINEFLIHWMAGTLAATDSTFQNRSRNTSAHYGVENTTIHQYVDVHNTAYHAGNWPVNQGSIGIEHSAQPGRDATNETYETSATLMAELIKQGIAKNAYRRHGQVVATQCCGTVDVARLANRVNEILKGVAGAPIVIANPEPRPFSRLTTVTVDVLNVRKEPNSKAALSGSKQVKKGQTFTVVGTVKGEEVRGNSTWLKSDKGNYLWSGGTDYPVTPAVAQAPAKPKIATVTGTANVRSQPRVYAALAGSKQLQKGQTFEYTAIVYGDYVNGNNKWYHSAKGNYVWSGNVKG